MRAETNDVELIGQRRSLCIHLSANVVQERKTCLCLHVRLSSCIVRVRPAVYDSAVVPKDRYDLLYHLRLCGIEGRAVRLVIDVDRFTPQGILVDEISHVLRESQKWRVRLVHRPPSSVSLCTTDTLFRGHLHMGLARIS